MGISRVLFWEIATGSDGFQRASDASMRGSVIALAMTVGAIHESPVFFFPFGQTETQTPQTAPRPISLYVFMCSEHFAASITLSRGAPRT